MVKVCCVCGAEQSRINSHLVFHRLPKDPNVQKQWWKVLKKDNVKALVVCNKHFEPEDYREFCDKPLLKKDAIPRLNLCKLNTCIQSIENNPIIFQDSMAKMDCHKETVETTNIDDSQNIMSVSKVESTISTKHLLGKIDETMKCLKRKNDSDCGGSSAPTKRCCYLKDFGTFRKENFKYKISWNRFLVALKKMRKEKLLLQRKNKRLLTKIQTFRDEIHELKEKNLVTDSVADVLNVNKS